MDDLFLDEFDTPIDPQQIKEIQIHDKNNMFQLNNNNNVVDSLDNYDINTETIIHKQDNITTDNNRSKIFDISSIYTQEIKKELLLIDYNDMSGSNAYFNGSYECIFNLNKMYNNVIGFKLNSIIYENSDKSDSGINSKLYLDIIINNIPNEACINNLDGYNIVRRVPLEHPYHNGSGVDSYGFYSDLQYFYPINLNKISLSMKYNFNKNIDNKLIDLIQLKEKNKDNTSQPRLKFSLEFELTLLNR